MTIFYFVLGLALLIFLHELGHFSVAKACGVKVEEFSIGFGPRLFGFRIGETEYKLCLIPLGGYVRMLGQSDFGEDDSQSQSDPRSFLAKSLPKRAAVVVAGPVMNLLVAVLFWVFASQYGIQVPSFLVEKPVLLGTRAETPAREAGLQKHDKVLSVDQKAIETWADLLRYIQRNPSKNIQLTVDRPNQGLKTFSLVVTPGEPLGLIGNLGLEPQSFLVPTLVQKVIPASPAELAGIQKGDQILSIDGDLTPNVVLFSEKVSEISKSQKQEGLFQVLRKDGRIDHLTIRPRFDQERQAYLTGLVLGAEEPLTRAVLKKPFSESLDEAFQDLFWQTRLTFAGLKKIVLFEDKAFEQVQSIVAIGEVTSEEAKFGLGNFLLMISQISLQLGLFNLLPIPVLDGGHLAFMTYEAVFRRPLPVKIRLFLQQLFLLLLLSLMILVVGRDLLHCAARF